MKQMKTNHLLNKMIFQIAFGLIMVEIAGAITYMIDGIVTSRFLDATAMAANGVAVPVYSVLTIISGVLATGFQNIAGKQIGEGDIEKARNTWETTWHFALIISCVITTVDAKVKVSHMRKTRLKKCRNHSVLGRKSV